MSSDVLTSKIGEILDVILVSGLIKFLLIFFIWALITKFILFWVDRVICIWKLRSMNVIADDRYIQIDGVKGSAVRRGGFIKIKGEDSKTGEHCIRWVPLKKVIDDLGILVPVVTGRKEIEDSNVDLESHNEEANNFDQR